MRFRLNDRLRLLEAKIAPKVQAFVFVSFAGPDRPPRDEQLAAFRIAHGIGPSDPIHEVIITFDRRKADAVRALAPLST